MSEGYWAKEYEDLFDNTEREKVKLTAERDAARENHLKVMKERDAAYSLLDSFRNAHVQEHRWGQVCSLCIAAQRMTQP